MNTSSTSSTSSSQGRIVSGGRGTYHNTSYHHHGRGAGAGAGSTRQW